MSVLRENYATWLVGSHELSLARPRIMGILDVTSGAFPDGKGGVDVEAAAERGLDMLDEGADIIDVAAVPAAPGQEPLASNEEAERVVPVIRALVAEGAVVSVNTCHPDVAKMCVRLGAAIVNDANGFTSPDMVQVAAETNCGCVVMHWEHAGLGSHTPRREVLLDDSRPTRSAAPRPMASQHRFTLPDEAPIMRQVMGFLGDQARTLMRAGVAHDRICLDPGAGFDKFADEDVVIQRAAAQPDEMDAATYGICVSAIQNGARILRVHDVAGAAQAVNAFWAVSHKDSRQGFVALGSNVGDRLANITRAVQLIDDIPLTCVVSVSHAYETEPAYGITTPVADAVAEIRTELHPLVLMGQLLAVEDALGRERDPGQAGHGPRTIDCDLVWVEGETHAGRRLTLPHPGLGERDFVLVPMEDLMHDPARFLRHSGVNVVDPDDRVGHVMDDLGEIVWE